ncbi:carbohydrate-binding protein [Neiella sp. HB171785]|uniref:Carbohydrate-binding protein n=1 Tax=Neiella litorisoli TaxID=2771431 RepID=A0A8J6QIU5_9GAMM|nr:carbohydrate-binding protein [Neiella litorisoli]MBD1390995.1 carbohydrate-binding protein [Neiella litorisoli]
MLNRTLPSVVAALGLCWSGISTADNPLVTHIYTADPTARVFGDTLYVFPSHDIVEHDGLRGLHGFMMPDYHLFSSQDLMNFKDHGVILHQDQISWIEPNSFEMWAPDAVEKDGKYYFYFPAQDQIGVAIAEQPTGPYVPMQQPIAGTAGIDPNVLIDDDGTSYLFWARNHEIKAMRLKDNMMEGAEEPVIIGNLSKKYKEGPFVFKRNGLYYLTYPVDEHGNEEIAYATSDKPLGPYTYRGVIMDMWPDCWTNHHSIVQYQGQWYLFYHHHDLSFDASLRSMAADKLFFNTDGSIQKVQPTRRGIGIRSAAEMIQVDRFDASSGLQTPIHREHEPAGMYVTGITDGSWLTYSGVDFEQRRYQSVSARINNNYHSGTINIRLDNAEGLLIGRIDVPANKGKPQWQTVRGKLLTAVTGQQNLHLSFTSATDDQPLFDLNWIRFDVPNTAQFYIEGRGEGTVRINGHDYQHFEPMPLLTINDLHKLELEAQPADGSIFTGWKINDVSVNQLPIIANGDRISAVFEKPVPARSIHQRIEAASFQVSDGVVVEPVANGTEQIGYINSGDYLRYDNIDFGDGGELRLTVRAASNGVGGTILLYQGSMDTTPIAQVEVSDTGGWDQWQSFVSQATSKQGQHDLYVKFTGQQGFLMNYNWLEFSQLE